MENLNVYTYSANGNYSTSFNWNDGGSYSLGNCLGVLNNNLVEKLKGDEFFKADLHLGVCQNLYNDHAGSWSESGYVVAKSKKHAQKMLKEVADKCYNETYQEYESN